MENKCERGCVKKREGKSYITIFYHPINNNRGRAEGAIKDETEAMPTARHFLSSLTIADNISFGNKRRLKCEGSTFSNGFLHPTRLATLRNCSHSTMNASRCPRFGVEYWADI